jgi:hypothetical protein
MKDILSRLEFLIKEHRQIDSLIATGYKNYLHDEELNTLKKKKLHLKEQIDKLNKLVNK